MEDNNPNIRKLNADLLRNKALELYSVDDDSELRSIFDSVGGIETRIKVMKLLNGRVEAWKQLFQTIDNLFLNNNITSSINTGNATFSYFQTYDK